MEDRLADELPSLLHQVAVGDVHGPPSNCQMDVLGRHLLYAIRVLSHFSSTLVKDSYLSTYTDQILEELVEEDDGSLLDYVDTKFEALKYVPLLSS